ncbi:hypothetical protein [Thalassospira povalilytica]|uniref:PepSY domain-containing protein n=1 Tax=Thalassospira povalilytica TaxID=732237 RepID=A0ABX4R5R3_9PROT|nr:hypothetical protein [Thalassospira povalilytica]PKR48328.1 hypothetical protein CU041_16685 [Thalassospira povalilytica]
MKRNNKLKLAAVLIASGVIATPIAAAQAGQGGYGGHGGPGEWSMFGGDHHGGKFDGDRGDHRKGGKFDRENRERAVPLTPAEARILIDAMLLKTGTIDLKTGDALMAEEPGKIDVLVVNAQGGVVEVVKFDAKTGRMDRDERHDLRKLLPRPDKAERYNRKFTADQMNLLASAMVIRFGNGELKLGGLAETPRGTYTATVTNQAGDIVREMELSSVTGRPIS